jgi:3-oxoacyl-[acyl-carrier-protein] synthase III
MIDESYLCCISLTAGETFEIDVTSSLPNKMADLVHDGFRKYFSSDYNTVSLLTSAAQKLLNLSKLAPEAIDAFLIVTESFWDTTIQDLHDENLPEHQKLREKILRSFCEIGLSGAVPYANWISACGNLAPSIGIASALVRSCQHNHVLIAAADRQIQNTDRVMDNGASIFSDGAAACIVTKVKNGYRIIDVISHAHLPLLSIQDNDDYLGFFLQMQKALQEFSTIIKKRIGRPTESFQYLITDNYSTSFLKIFADALKLSPEKLLTPTKRYGHVFSVDTLWSLHHLQNEKVLKKGDIIGLLNIGLCTWSLVVLEMTTLTCDLTQEA